MNIHKESEKMVYESYNCEICNETFYRKSNAVEHEEKCREAKNLSNQNKKNANFLSMLLIFGFLMFLFIGLWIGIFEISYMECWDLCYDSCYSQKGPNFLCRRLCCCKHDFGCFPIDSYD